MYIPLRIDPAHPPRQQPKLIALPIALIGRVEVAAEGGRVVSTFKCAVCGWIDSGCLAEDHDFAVRLLNHGTHCSEANQPTTAEGRDSPRGGG